MSAGRPVASLVALALAASIALAGCPDDDDDDTTAPADDDDSSGGDPLTAIELAGCLDDLGCDYVFGVGHRGATTFAPENTLVGFDRALELGMEAIELDVRPTADEVLVLMHDSTVDRTTDGSGRVDEMTLAQIRELAAVSAFDDVDDQPVPTFAEALSHLRGRALINVDAKTSRFDLIAADIAAADAAPWCFVQVDSLDEGHALRAADPTLRLMPDIEVLDDVARYGDALQPELVEVPWNLDDPAVFSAEEQRGARVAQNALGPADAAAAVHAAGGDDPCQAFAPIWARGVALIQTDVPDLLAPCLRARNAGAGYTFDGDRGAAR